MPKRSTKDEEDDDVAIQLDDDPKEKMKKVWFRALISDIEGWNRAADAAGMSTSAWLRALANRAARNSK